jgi:hypothetical protein
MSQLPQNAVRLHVKRRFTDDQPADFRVDAEGKVCERSAMRKMLKSGEFYLGCLIHGKQSKQLGYCR